MGDLTDRKCKTAGEGKYSDGKGLYLIVDGKGRRWLFRYQVNGRRREMGLGPYPEIGLAAAREKASAARSQAKSGVDPIDARRADRAVPLFGVFADELVDSIESGFRNEKHRAQWRMTLGDAYCKTLRTKPVDEIDTAAVLKVLQPIWVTKSETASRIRGRIERVLDAAKAQGFRSGENPARWKGHLDAMLSKRQKLTRGHHKALAYQDVPALVSRLQGMQAVAARALEFLILTAGRTGEVVGACWNEVDMTSSVWTVPAKRMKAAREHRVPLTDRAITILQELEQMRTETGGDWVFPGGKPGKPLSNMALTAVLKRLDIQVTVHGFRSAFRDWCGEESSFPREIAEAALAHRVGDATELAYRRGDALERRRRLMDDWAGFVLGMPQVASKVG